jgi:hypothetical protein
VSKSGREPRQPPHPNCGERLGAERATFGA